MKLGTRVTAPGKLIRVCEDDKRLWCRPFWSRGEIIGIYVGVRSYKNGIVLWKGEEEGYTFHTESTIKVALIVTDARHKPVPVLYSEMTILEEENGTT